MPLSYLETNPAGVSVDFKDLPNLQCLHSTNLAALATNFRRTSRQVTSSFDYIMKMFGRELATWITDIRVQYSDWSNCEPTRSKTKTSP